MDFTDLKDKMKMTMQDFVGRLAKVRVGVVNEMMFNGIYIDNTEFSKSTVLITEIATFKKLDANTIRITPWDKKLVKKIAKAISNSPLDVTPINDGVDVVVKFSPVTQESRNKAAKVVKDLGEDAKVAIRQIRKNENQRFKKLIKNPLAPEFVKGLHDVQKITDDFIVLIDKEIERKQKDLKGD